MFPEQEYIFFISILINSAQTEFFLLFNYMKIKNSQIFLIIGTFLGVYILLAGYLSILKPVDVEIKTEKINDNIVAFEIIPEEVAQSQTPEPVPKALAGKIDNSPDIKVLLTVLDKNYELEVKENSSVFDAMKELETKNDGDFSFKYNEYPSMGIFVYEINGMKETRGSYWLYYVNDKEASVGVSSYILKEGDSILWKQE
jgi:hypothetical protein